MIVVFGGDHTGREVGDSAKPFLIDSGLKAAGFIQIQIPGSYTVDAMVDGVE